MVNDDDDDDMYVLGYCIIALTVASTRTLNKGFTVWLVQFNTWFNRGWGRAEGRGGGILRELLRAFVKKGPCHSPFVSERLAHAYI
eukprot:scaffold164647_cov70-Cyclotella_meneghiniana.AAC.3